MHIARYRQFNHCISCVSESSVQHVCIGGSITLFCNSSTGRVRWTINLPESVEPDPVTRSISNTRLTEETFPVTGTVFHILRRSDYNTTPLVTSLLLENVSADINETNISCSIPNSDSDEILMQFMILVIDSHRHGKQDQSNLIRNMHDHKNCRCKSDNKCEQNFGILRDKQLQSCSRMDRRGRFSIQCQHFPTSNHHSTCWQHRC